MGRIDPGPDYQGTENQVKQNQTSLGVAPLKLGRIVIYIMDSKNFSLLEATTLNAIRLYDTNTILFNQSSATIYSRVSKSHSTACWD